MATINVVWGPFLKLGERWTPSRINQIFEGASFQLEGSISAAQKPPGGIEGDWMSPTFITGLDTTLDPQGVDWALIHDTSVGKPQKVSLTNLLSLGFAAAAPVTGLLETDEFNVLVGGTTAAKISLPNARRRIFDPPGVLNMSAGTDILLDWIGVLDVSASEAKKMSPTTLVRSVTDRVVPTSGTNEFAVVSGLGIGALATGVRLIVRFHQAVLAGATLNVDGLGARALRTADDLGIVSSTLAMNRIAELIYDQNAASGAGGWLVQGVEAVTSAVFDGTTPRRSSLTCNANSTGIVNIGSGTNHGFAAGEIVWTLSTAPTGLSTYTPYYVILIVGSTSTFKLATSKARAAAGLNVTLTGPTSFALESWSADPLKRAQNVDGILQHSSGNYLVDFAVPMPNANYMVQVTGTYAASGVQQAVVATTHFARDVEGFGIYCWGNTSDVGDCPSVNLLVLP